MALLLAKLKWNQGYRRAYECAGAAVHCKVCAHVLATVPPKAAYYRCDFNGAEGRFRCEPGGSCSHAESDNPWLRVIPGGGST